MGDTQRDLQYGHTYLHSRHAHSNTPFRVRIQIHIQRENYQYTLFVHIQIQIQSRSLSLNARPCFSPIVFANLSFINLVSIFDQPSRGVSLSEVLLLFKPEIKTPKRGSTEFLIQMADNPAPHVFPCISVVVIRPTVQGTQPPPCVMTTGVENGGRSKFQSLRRTRVTPNSSTAESHDS